MNRNNNTGQAGELSDREVQLLTEARTAKWKLEAYEFAYDLRVRTLWGSRIVLEFLAVLVAVAFLYLQYLVKEHEPIHAVVGYVGTGMSLLVILMVVWCHIAAWPAQIDKLRDLSSEIRTLISEHKKAADARPLEEAALERFLRRSLEFEEKRKHPHASVARIYMKRAHQHVGNLYPNSGFGCALCGKVWKPEFNRRARWTWVPLFGCNQCGV